MFNLKKKVKNKAHVEASICEAYIVKEISTFISYYFEPHLRTRINRVPRHDDGGEVSSSGNLSIFSNLGRPIPKNVIRGRYLSEIDFRQAHNYRFKPLNVINIQLAETYISKKMTDLRECIPYPF